MRLKALALCLTLASAPVWAQQGQLPNATVEEAGRAAEYGQFLCQIPPSQIDAFKLRVDAFVPGGSRSAAFAEGERGARALIDKARASDTGDTRELATIYCPESRSIIDRIMVTPVP